MHQKQWEFLKKKFESDQLSHAYLFAGQENLGKAFFAKEFVKFINCKNPVNGKACQKCFSCLAIEREAFPDFKILRASKKDEVFGDGGEIKISQVREVQNFLSYKSYYGSFKAVIVEGAESMNQEAQNCFLKTLEEPKGKTLLILVCAKPDMLLPTIYSRCQIIKFFGRPKLDPQKIEQENKILQDVLKVIGRDLSEKFKYAKSLDFQEQSLSAMLVALQKYFRLRLLEAVSSDLPISKLKKDIELIEDISNKVSSTNANPKLALEVLLMQI